MWEFFRVFYRGFKSKGYGEFFKVVDCDVDSERDRVESCVRMNGLEVVWILKIVFDYECYSSNIINVCENIEGS